MQYNTAPKTKGSLSLVTDEHQPIPKWNVLNVAGIFAPLEPVKYLIETLDLCPGAPSMLVGPGFSGKTVAAQSALISVAAGSPVWGSFQARKGRVLHIDFEQGPRLTCERYQRLAAGLAVSVDGLGDRLELVSMPSTYLDSAGAESNLLQRCAGIDLVVIDSLRAACPNMEENDSSARATLDMLNRVSDRTGSCFLVIHHTRKPQTTRGGVRASGGAKASIRGSGALFDACGSVLVFDAVKGEPIRVMHEKARASGVLVDDFMLTIQDAATERGPRGGLVVTTGTLPTRTPARSLEALKEAIRERFKGHGDQPGKNALCKTLGVNRTDFYAAMAELMAAGEIIDVGRYKAPLLRLVSP